MTSVYTLFKSGALVSYSRLVSPTGFQKSSGSLVFLVSDPRAQVPSMWSKPLHTRRILKLVVFPFSSVSLLVVWVPTWLLLVLSDLSLQDSLQKSHPVSSQVYFSKSYSIYICSFDVFESECSILLLCYHDYSISHYFFKEALFLFLPLFFWNSNNLQVISFGGIP